MYVHKYSKDLLKRFQEEYAKQFGENISIEAADTQLNSLARIVEGILPEPEQIITDLKERSSYELNIS